MENTNKWPWPSTPRWRFKAILHNNRWKLYDVWLDWAKDEHVWDINNATLDVGAESLEDLKDALTKMLKQINKQLKEQQ